MNRGKAMGGIITGIRKEIEEDKENEEKINSEAIQLRKVILDKESWKIVTAYNGKGIGDYKKYQGIDIRENEGNLVIEEDFNARIGEERTIIWRDDRDEIGRKLKDKIVNLEGKKFLEEIGKRG